MGHLPSNKSLLWQEANVLHIISFPFLAGSLYQYVSAMIFSCSPLPLKGHPFGRRASISCLGLPTSSPKRRPVWRRSHKTRRERTENRNQYSIRLYPLVFPWIPSKEFFSMFKATTRTLVNSSIPWSWTAHKSCIHQTPALQKNYWGDSFIII